MIGLQRSAHITWEPARFLAIGVDSTFSYIWRALWATDSYRGIALSGLMPAPPSIIQPGGVVRFRVLIVVAAGRKGRLERRPLLLLDDLDDAPRARFNQNRAAVHHCVAMVAYTVLRRHVVIGDAFLREDRPNPYIFAILIRRASLFDDVGTEAGTLIDAEDAGYAADHATNDCPDRTSRSFTISRTLLDATGDTLGLGSNR